MRAFGVGGLILSLTMAPVAHAQPSSPITIGVDAMTTRAVRDAAVTRVLSGPVLSARGSLALGWFRLDGDYAEGTLTPEGGGASAAEDFLDARLIARVSVRPWLSVGIGPHLRGFVTPAGTARWARTEVHARVTSELINDVAVLVIDAWQAVATEANVQGGGVSARGGEAGVLIRIPRTPAALQLSYMADRGTYALGGSEFVEGVRASLILDRISPPRGRVR